MGRDKRFLELHHGKYRVVVTVPKALYKFVGATKLKRPLGTDSLAVANELKWAVVKDLKEKLLACERKFSGADRGVRHTVLEQAAGSFDATPEDFGSFSQAIISDRLRTILGKPVRHGTDAGTRIPNYHTEHESLADDFVSVPLHGNRAIANADAAYKEKRLRVSPRTEDDHDRALKMLAAFCIRQGLGDEVGKIDEYVVSDFVAYLENEKRMAARTIKKYVSRLSLYFAYLKSLRQITTNPWREAVVYMPTAKNNELERPFTEQEVATLLTGNCKQALKDVMMIAALTGARLDAVVDLKAGDVIDNKAFRFKPQKRERGERFVPIHSDLMEIVERRLRGKKPEDDLFPEYPGDPGKPNVERSFRASKHFTTYRRSLGVDDIVAGKRRSRVNFHSFRRWFITKAERSGSAESLIAAIVGHTRKGITLGHYSEGPEMMTAREAVEKVRLPPLDGSPAVQPQAISPRS